MKSDGIINEKQIHPQDKAKEIIKGTFDLWRKHHNTDNF